MVGLGEATAVSPGTAAFASSAATRNRTQTHIASCRKVAASSVRSPHEPLLQTELCADPGPTLPPAQGQQRPVRVHTAKAHLAITTQAQHQSLQCLPVSCLASVEDRAGKKGPRGGQFMQRTRERGQGREFGPVSAQITHTCTHTCCMDMYECMCVLCAPGGLSYQESSSLLYLNHRQGLSIKPRAQLLG